MRRLALLVHDYSLDGFVAEEGSEFFKICRDLPDVPEYEAWLTAVLRAPSLHIMGRSTYQGMAQFFPTGTDAIADAMNQAVKTVFSHTLTTADWPTTTIVSGDTAEEIGK